MKYLFNTPLVTYIAEWSDTNEFDLWAQSSVRNEGYMSYHGPNMIWLAAIKDLSTAYPQPLNNVVLKPAFTELGFTLTKGDGAVDVVSNDGTTHIWDKLKLRIPYGVWRPELTPRYEFTDMRYVTSVGAYRFNVKSGDSLGNGIWYYPALYVNKSTMDKDTPGMYMDINGIFGGSTYTEHTDRRTRMPVFSTSYLVG